MVGQLILVLKGIKILHNIKTQIECVFILLGIVPGKIGAAVVLPQLVFGRAGYFGQNLVSKKLFNT